MRERSWRGRIWAARLGLLALALNALVPVHLAFDLAEAFEPGSLCSVHFEPDDAERHLLALLAGHRDAGGKSDGHGKHHVCPVCSALGALAGITPPAAPALFVPPPAGLPAALSVIEGDRAGAPAGYNSRAPPLA